MNDFGDLLRGSFRYGWRERAAEIVATHLSATISLYDLENEAQRNELARKIVDALVDDDLIYPSTHFRVAGATLVDAEDFEAAGRDPKVIALLRAAKEYGERCAEDGT